MIVQYQPFYPLTLRELRKGIAQNLEYAAQIQAEMREAEDYLDGIIETHKRCPLCGGSMLDLSLLSGIQVFIHGSPATTLSHLGTAYGMRVPYNSWECQHCGAFITTAPPDNAQIWTQQDISPQSKSLAALIFEYLPFVNTVAYRVTAYQSGWFLGTGDEWYYIEGPKARIIEALGMD